MSETLNTRLFPGTGVEGAAASFAHPPAEPLSRHLRAATRAEHEAVELCTGWPDSIADVEDYRRCLRGLLAVWRPFEAALAEPRDWSAFAAGALRRSRLPPLERDLRGLGGDPVAIPALAVEVPADLPGLVGAVYVLEGSALGGRVIRADLLRRLGPDLGQSLAFFSGDGGGPSWRDIAGAVDAFGALRPACRPAVVAGARQTFAAFLRAFGPDPDVT